MCMAVSVGCAMFDFAGLAANGIFSVGNRATGISIHQGELVIKVRLVDGDWGQGTARTCRKLYKEERRQGHSA
jgi:hypothetical protein